MVEPGDCVGRLCGYGVAHGKVGCDSGDGSCWAARLLEADVSGFHDETLQEATLRIKAILDAIPPDADGRKLSFVHTENGTLLAWVNHAAGLPPDAVTYSDDPDMVAAALRLRPVGPTQAY